MRNLQNDPHLSGAESGVCPRHGLETGNLQFPVSAPPGSHPTNTALAGEHVISEMT